VERLRVPVSYPASGRSAGDLRPPAEVAGFVWNQWQLCRGMDGRFRLESVAGLVWNTQLTPAMIG